ncbi:hypothetical protein [Gordonia sp. 'Campus']|uniref:hypothetical protein n=1 Tax=Gordonia sp. 'Campus' TaxID=2915824 RepID=UPI001EE425CF|nr:hypothetical protein [Gordonia sp. 'Campus']
MRDHPIPADARRVVEDLAPGVWPTADAAELRDAANRLRALAGAVEDVAGSVTSAAGEYANRAAQSAGEFRDAVVVGLEAITGAGPDSSPAVVTRLLAMAGSVDAYADTVVETRQQMALIALVADRDLRRADVLAEVGDDSWRVGAASAGRMALTAAGDDHTERSGEAGQDAGAPAATSGMMPMMPTGAMGAAGAVAAGVGALAGAGVARERTDVADLVWLRQRAERVQTTVPGAVAGWFRTAVGVGAGERGVRVIVVGTNDPQPYQRPGLELADDEALTADGRAPELAIADHMVSSGIIPLAIAAATPMAPATVSALRAADIVVVEPGSRP